MLSYSGILFLLSPHPAVYLQIIEHILVEMNSAHTDTSMTHIGSRVDFPAHTPEKRANLPGFPDV
jgi:hypothetical protein